MKQNLPSAVVNIMAAGICLFMLVGTSYADDPKAREIVRKMYYENRYVHDAVTDTELILIDKNGDQRIKRFRNWFKYKGDDAYIIRFFYSPADTKGIAFLTHDYQDPNKDDDNWMYLPALGKAKRIASSDLDTSWMGSDFYLSNMMAPNMNDFEYNMVKKEKVKVREWDTWVIEAIPNEKAIDGWGYSRAIFYVNKHYLDIRGIFWVAKSSKIKYYDVKKTEEFNGVWIRSLMTMTTKVGKVAEHQSVIRRLNINIDTKDYDFFASDQMAKGIELTD